MSCECGCCAGVHVATPTRTWNRPGLSRIEHRPGRHATFVQSMHARLSSTQYPELAGLKTRAGDDPAIALCDAWAVTAEVLSFYQDRIANEGYLRTSTERRSLLELGRLIGYALRPGVAASVYLAYDLDPNAGRLTIPPGTRAQSVPAAGEKMQTFETAEALDARAQWSRIKVRQDQPTWRSRDAGHAGYGVLAKGLRLRGTSTGLAPDDALLLDYGDGATPQPFRVAGVTIDNDAQTTQVALRLWNDTPSPFKRSSSDRAPVADAASAVLTRQSAGQIVAKLTTPSTIQPRSAAFLARDASTTLLRGADIHSRLLARQSPVLRDMLVPALRSFDAAGPARQPIKVYALRTKAALFGSNAPNQVMAEIRDGLPVFANLDLALAWRDLPQQGPPREGHATPVTLLHLPLDRVHDAIKVGRGERSWVLVDFGDVAFKDALDTPPLSVHELVDNGSVTMSIGSAISSQVSQLVTRKPWLALPPRSGDRSDPGLAILRRTRIHAQSELLELARDPMDATLASNASSAEIELDEYYDDLMPGQWVIAAGDRADIGDPQIKVPAAERAMIAAVRHDVARLPDALTKPLAGEPLPGDTLHTFITLAAPLAYAYRRATFTLYGNVVRATHGETRNEVLGGGDATRTFQAFTLKSPPLTQVAAATPNGIASTLQVRVNNLLWQATENLAGAAADARVHAIRRDDNEASTVHFGDGVHGARLPSGADNVTARYRSGLGSAGNVRVGQVTLATDKPLGVKGVFNPVRASGGADADTLEQARVNAPLSVTALDRLVSIRDYADFSRGFAGIGKAVSIGLHDGVKAVVHVTIAGIDDEPIDRTSDVFINLVAALRAYGDPHLPVHVAVRDALLLIVRARIAIDPAHRWEDVQPRVRETLIERFGFAARELGQPLFKSEILAAIDAVRGVVHVSALDVRALDYATLVAGLDPVPPLAVNGVDQSRTRRAGIAESAWIDVASAALADDGRFAAAQIAYLAADVADSLILELVP